MVVWLTTVLTSPSYSSSPNKVVCVCVRLYMWVFVCVWACWSSRCCVFGSNLRECRLKRWYLAVSQHHLWPNAAQESRSGPSSLVLPYPFLLHGFDGNLLLISLFFSHTDSQRDLPLRSSSGYVPDEIWRKAGKGGNPDAPWETCFLPYHLFLSLLSH